MKIEYAVMSSDDNPLYLDFWDVVAPLWGKLKITPVLLYFGEGNPSKEHGIVVKMKSDVNIPLATCWARYWWVAQQGISVSIITDIDMLPLSDFYFNSQLQKYSDDKYVHINPCIDTYSRLPSCYHIANGYTFSKVLEIEKDWNESYSKLLKQKFDNKECFIQGGNELWCYDEFYATEKILNDKSGRVILTNRTGGQSGHRIDRTDWNIDDDKLKSGYYYDCHSARPYSQFKEDIDYIINNSK